MSKTSKYLQQAIHNKEPCFIIKDLKNYNDWVITTAFYSALHFVCHKLFPLDATINGKKFYFSNFENYRLFLFQNHKSRSKHKILSELVLQYLPSLQPNYDFLKDLSWKARYNHYQLQQCECDTAIKYLEYIERECIK
jgi:hypothetical protein